MAANQPPSNCMRILLEIAPDEGLGLPHPCFKSDGQRFAEADTTLKLVREGRYRLSFVCSPPATINLAEIASKRGLAAPLILDLSGGITDAALGISTHSVEWTCSLEACKKNTRHALEVQLDVQGFGPLTLPLQLKVYEAVDKSVLHGSKLRYLQYLFRSKSDSMALAGFAAFGL